jgi:hypothetical protein
MSKYLRLKTLLDKLAPVKVRGPDHADATEWTRSMRTVPWTLWFGRPGAYTRVFYIWPLRIGHVKPLETENVTR